MGYTKSMIQWADKSSSDNRIVFESIPSEEHSVDNTVTEFPVETGFVVSDHVIRKNRTLKLEVMSTNAVFRERETSNTMNDSNKVKSDFDAITTLVQTGTVVNVTTILGVYVDCVITKFATRQDVNTASVMQGTLIIKELQVVGVEGATASKQALIDMAGTTEEAEVLDAKASWEEISKTGGTSNV